MFLWYYTIKQEKNESIDGIQTLCIMENVEFSAGGVSTYCASHAMLTTNSFQNHTCLLNMPSTCFDFNVYKQTNVNIVIKPAQAFITKVFPLCIHVQGPRVQRQKPISCIKMDCITHYNNSCWYSPLEIKLPNIKSKVYHNKGPLYAHSSPPYLISNRGQIRKLPKYETRLPE